MTNGAGATKWTGSIAVTAILVFAAISAAGTSDSSELVRANAPANAVTITFDEGSSETWIVPPGVNSISVTAVGARGFGAPGGLGAIVSATVPVEPGEELEVRVAYRDTGGCTLMEDRTSPNDIKIVAGGGGGAGQSTPLATGGDGGAAGPANGPARDGRPATTSRGYTYTGRILQATYSALDGWTVTKTERTAAVPVVDPAIGGAGARGSRPGNFTGGGQVATGRAGGGGAPGQPRYVADSVLLAVTGEMGNRTSESDLTGEQASAILGKQMSPGSTETVTISSITYEPGPLPTGGSGGSGGCGYAAGQGGGGGRLGGAGGGGGGGSSFVVDGSSDVQSTLDSGGRGPELIIVYAPNVLPMVPLVTDASGGMTASSGPATSTTLPTTPAPSQQVLTVGSHSLRAVASVSPSERIRSVNVSKSTSSNCRVRGSRLTALRPGSCTLRLVTVLYGRQSARTLTIRIR